MNNWVESEHAPGLLIPRHHASTKESEYTNSIVLPMIKEYFRGDIRLVGGRAAPDGPWWISKKKLFESFSKLQPTISKLEQMKTAILINTAARKNDLSIRDMGNLFKLLPKNLPKAVDAFLQGEYGPPGSDIDLRLEVPERHLPRGVREAYFDDKTKQTVEIWY